MAGPLKFLSKLGFKGVRSELDRELRSEKVRRYTVPNPYHAVSIAPGLMGACDVALKNSGTRYLSAEAPTLPLPGCDADKCTCRYQHHSDRRGAPRRSSDVQGLWRPDWMGQEKRRSSGRRITDN